MTLIGTLLFLLLAYINRKNSLYFFLLVIYAISFIATEFLQNYEYQRISGYAYTYLLVILLAFFQPFKYRINLSDVHSYKSLKYLAILFFVLLMPATFFYGYYGILTYMTVDLSVARIEGITLLPENMFNTIFAAASTLYFVPMMLFFLFLKEHKYRIFRMFLLFSTLSYPLLTLCYSGRDGILYWVMNMSVLILLFFKDSNKKAKRIVLRYLIIVMIPAAIIFLNISEARFGQRERGLSFSLISYLGQQTRHFSVAFENEFFNGKGTLFPGWYKLLGVEREHNELKDFADAGFINEYNVFAFFVKPIVCGYGKFMALLIAAIFAAITNLYMKLFIKQKHLIYFIIVFTLFQIPMNGVFYYRQGIGKGDVIFTIFLISLIIYKEIFWKKYNKKVKV